MTGTDQKTLTVLDVRGIQGYIFGSNQLRENIGASYLVEATTRVWLHETLKQLKLTHNVRADGTIDDSARIGVAYDVEVIYRGGGNVVLLSREREANAVALVRALTTRLLLDAPGLTLTAAHLQFSWHDDPIGGPHTGRPGVSARVFAALRLAKQQGMAVVPLGFGVTAECQATRQPAVTYDERELFLPEQRERLVGAEIAGKIATAVQDQAECRLREFLPQQVLDHFALTDELDQLGRAHGEQSLVAVIHADGNAMGNRFRDCAAQYPLASQNEECLAALRALSDAVERAGQKATQVALDAVAQSITALPDPRWKLLYDQLPLKEKNGASTLVFPVRPIVFGGDDMTLVCEGRLGLGIAVRYLEEFEQATKSLPFGGPGTACAGVAIVPVHYPFARAYQLAEQLCQRAKAEVKAVQAEAREEGEDQPLQSAMDWQFAMPGFGGGLENIQRAYTVEAGNLRASPVTLATSGFNGWRAWPSIAQAIADFRDTGTWSRNKVIGLRERLPGGGTKVEEYRRSFDLPKLPAIGGASGADEQGWYKGRCVYFDAIQAMDFTLMLV